MNPSLRGVGHWTKKLHNLFDEMAKIQSLKESATESDVVKRKRYGRYFLINPISGGVKNIR